MATAAPITPQEQIDCVRREVAYRKRVYAGLVAKGRMSTDFAARQIAVMESVQKKLEEGAPAPASPRDLFSDPEPRHA